MEVFGAARKFIHLDFIRFCERRFGPLELCRVIPAGK